MSDRLAKQVAERLRTMGYGHWQDEDLHAALAELAECRPHHFNEASEDRWDEALRRVSEALGITAKETK